MAVRALQRCPGHRVKRDAVEHVRPQTRDGPGNLGQVVLVDPGNQDRIDLDRDASLFEAANGLELAAQEHPGSLQAAKHARPVAHPA